MPRFLTTGLLTTVVAVQLGITPLQAGAQVSKFPFQDTAENSAVFVKREGLKVAQNSTITLPRLQGPHQVGTTSYTFTDWKRSEIFTRPLAKVKNSPPLVPPYQGGEARKIKLPPRSSGRVGEGSGAFLQEVYYRSD